MRRGAIGREKSQNPVLTCEENDYVDALITGLDAYYVHMGPAGPAAPDLTPPRTADPAELRRRIEAGEWVVDLRSRAAFAAGHLLRSSNFELGDSFATYLGRLIPWGTPLALLGETSEQVTTAQRELVRIGVDQIASCATRGPETWSGDANGLEVGERGRGERAQLPVAPTVEVASRGA